VLFDTFFIKRIIKHFDHFFAQGTAGVCDEDNDNVVTCFRDGFL
jgi:hypothetical protein